MFGRVADQISGGLSYEAEAVIRSYDQAAATSWIFDNADNDNHKQNATALSTLGYRNMKVWREDLLAI